jgi:hypothetical protein
MSTRSSSWSAVSLLLAVLAIVSCAAPPRAESQALRARRGSYELQVLVDGRPARTFTHGGETHVLGAQGARYVLRIHNRSDRRIEAVVSVDGIDVIDGETGDYVNKRGYLVPAYSSVDIDGWRLNNQEAAAFRFAAIEDSYAGKTGRARNVGVIGVAVFPERAPPEPVYVPRAQPEYSRAPRDDSYDSLERMSSGRSEAKGEGRASEAEAAPTAPTASAAPAASLGGSGAPDESAARAAPQKRKRSGLGTEFGEALSSQIHHVSFERAQASRPSILLGARYNDRAGLIALGIDVDPRPSEVSLRQSASPFPVSQHYARPPRDWRRD